MSYFLLVEQIGIEPITYTLCKRVPPALVHAAPEVRSNSLYTTPAIFIIERVGVVETPSSDCGEYRSRTGSLLYAIQTL